MHTVISSSFWKSTLHSPFLFYITSSLHRWTPWTHRLYQLPQVPFLSIQHGSSPIWLWFCTKDILTSRPTMTSPCQISGPLLHTWTLLVLSWLITHSFSKSCLVLAPLSSLHHLTILSWTCNKWAAHRKEKEPYYTSKGLLTRNADLFWKRTCHIAMGFS